MATVDDVLALDALGQAAAVRRGDVTPGELVEGVIRRIERVNPRLNAVVTPMFEQARAAARAVLPEGPFRGVPFLLKDLMAAYAGVPMTAGSEFLRDVVPDHDGELVARHKRAGLVIAGKTNTPEMGLVPTTEPRLFGPARNPWDPTRSTGGSSGGSAAAVAAGIVAFAHGNDGGGSIRIPASCCGLFGLKPSRGRNPLGPDVGDVLGGLACDHAMTRSVRDSAALLDATAGPDVGDPYAAPAPARPFLAEVGAPPGRLRIGFTVTAPTGVPIHPDCVAAVRDVAALCADLGHEVVEASPEADGQEVLRAFMTVYATGHASLMDAASRATGRRLVPEHFEPTTWAIYEMGREVRGPDYLLAVMALQRLGRATGRFHLRHDLWLTPTIAEPPAPLGSFDAPADDPFAPMLRAAAYVPFTALANATGQPAMSVPLVWNAAGLPIGLHFVARLGDEATLFRLAAQLEAARPWAARRPSVFAS
jgi:amidase